MRDKQRVRISIDGISIEAVDGSQLTAALLEAGYVSLRQSPTGQPRGVLCAMGSCHECRATVDGHRGVRTCLVSVRDGMKIETETDLKPGPFDGVKILPPREQSAEVVVIGAGPAGLAAACTAAEHGCDVLMVDESPAAGGRIWAHRETIPQAAREWIDRARRVGVGRLQGYCVVDGEPGRLTAASVTTGERVDIRCKKIVIATGARERFLPFSGWTLPGVVGAGALQSLIKGGFDVKGKRLIVAGSGPLLLAVARLAHEQGASVLLVEQASIFDRLSLLLPLITSRTRLGQAFEMWKSLRDVEKLSSSWPIKAEGDGQLKRVHLRTEQGVRVEEVDGLAVGFGLLPETRLAQGLGCPLDGNGNVLVNLHQATSVEGVYCAGEPTGIVGCEGAVDGGMVAGISVAGGIPRAHLLARVRKNAYWGLALERAHPIRPELLESIRGDVVLCRCEDVCAATALRSGSLREARMLFRVGMGPCQGRVCMSILEQKGAHPRDSVRPPWTTTPAPRKDLQATD